MLLMFCFCASFAEGYRITDLYSPLSRSFPIVYPHGTEESNTEVYEYVKGVADFPTHHFMEDWAHWALSGTAMVPQFQVLDIEP